MVTVSGITELGVIIGTVAALLYTVMTALPGAVAWDEFDVVDNHFRSATEAQWVEFTGCAGTKVAYTFPNGTDVNVPHWDTKRSSKDCSWESPRWDKTQGTRFSAYTDPAVENPIRIGKYGCQFRDDNLPWQPMSTRLGNQFSVASTYLMISLVFSVIFTISVNALTQVKEDGDPERDMVVPDDAVEAWFFWGRWIVIFTVMTFVYGCMQSINVLNDIYYLKWPQVWLEHLCKDNGWTPVLDVNGSEVTFDTQAEISAVQYEGGRFVAYTSSYSFSRIFGKELLIGNALDATRTYTSFENIDPLQQNGLGVFLFLGLTAVAVSMLGYAQACADTNVKDYFVAKQKERDEAENGTFEGGGHGSGGTFNGGGGADGVIVETDFEEVGTMLKGQQAAASSRAAPSIQMRTNKSRERPLSEAFDGFDDAGGEKHLAKKKEKKPKKQETAAQRHSVTSDGQPATSGLGTFVAPNAESTTDLTASTPAGIGDW